LACLNNLKQLGVAVRMFSDENEGKLPLAEQLPTQPGTNPPLPRICDLLAPQLSYNTNAMPQQNTVFRCPDDNAQRFEQNGSSYEWNNWYGGRPVDSPRHSQNPISDAFLMPTTKTPQLRRRQKCALCRLPRHQHQRISPDDGLMALTAVAQAAEPARWWQAGPRRAGGTIAARRIVPPNVAPLCAALLLAARGVPPHSPRNLFLRISRRFCA
jgi:hypothetical protein